MAYVRAGGDERFLAPITDYFGKKTAAEDIGQAAIDAAALAILPYGKPATLNRQVYTPIAAILRHNGIMLALRRPRGAQGQRRTYWLRPEQFEAVAAAAGKIDAELGVLMVTLCYTGMRLSEALHLKRVDMNLSAAAVQLGVTKNGDPRAVHLPPRVVAALASLPTRPRVFRFTKNGKLNALARSAYVAAGVPCGTAPFHVLRHTWATWMVGIGADLVATGAWKSQTAARGYTHFVASNEARKADVLPGANGALLVSRKQVVEK